MDYRQDPLYKKFKQEQSQNNQQQNSSYKQDPLYAKFKQEKQRSQKRLETLNEYIPDFAEDFIYGSAKNIADYTASAAKMFGNNDLQRRARVASETLDNNVGNEWARLAGEIVGDPLNLTPAGIVSKGSKVGKIGKVLTKTKPRAVATSMGLGAGIGAGTMAAKDYGNDAMSTTEKVHDAELGAGIVAGLNGLISAFTKGRVNNVIKPEMVQGAKSDDDIANAILKNSDAFGLTPDEASAVHSEVLKGKYPKVPDAYKVEQAGFVKKSQPNFQMRPNNPSATMDINTALAVLAREADKKRVAQGLEPIYQHKYQLQSQYRKESIYPQQEEQPYTPNFVSGDFNNNIPTPYNADVKLSPGELEEANAVFAKGLDNVAAGTYAGIGQDENGNITFDPEKFILGLGGYTAVKHALMNGTIRGKLKDIAVDALDRVNFNPEVQKQGNSFNSMSPVKSKVQKEKRGIYNVTFNGKNSTQIKANDLDDLVEYAKGTRKYGAKHILSRHYGDGKVGEITQEEITQFGEIIRNGEINPSSFKETKNGISYVYEMKDGDKLLQVVVDETNDGRKILSGFTDKNYFKKEDGTKQGLKPSSNETIIPQKNKNIKANGMHSIAGGFAGGADSLINQRDYNGDGEYNYKDLLAGVAAGTISINALKKLAPKLFEDEAGKDGFKAGLFAGSKAKGFDAAKRAGKTFDGKYDTLERFEIDDSKAKLKNLARYVNTKDGTKLENILDHKELFANYPELKDISVKFHNGSGSSFSRDGIEIGIKDFKTKDDFKSTLLHELQHSIQKEEGFARGGSAQEFYNDFKKKINLLKYELEFEPDDFIRDKKLKQLSELESKYKDGGKEEAFKMYQNLAGEIEARDIQARADYTPEQREKIEPYSSEDIAPEDAVMRFNNSDDALIDGLTQKHARELEDKYLNKSSDRVLENEIMKDASELPKPKSFNEFTNDFKTDKWTSLDTPIGKVSFNVSHIYKHFTDNTYFKDRGWLTGAFKDALEDPLFVIKNPLKEQIEYYKPYKDENGLIHYVGIIKDNNGNLKQITSFNKDIGSIKSMIKVPDGNMLYFKNTKKVDTPITNDGGMTSNSKGVEPLSDKHSSHTKSATNKGKTSALNEWENRSADEIISQEKQMSQTQEEFLGKVKEAKKKGYAHVSKIVSEEAKKEWGDAASTLKRWFTDTLGAKYHDIRESATASTNGMSVKLERLHRALKELNEADRVSLHDYIAGETKDINPTLKPLADKLKQDIDNLSKDLVSKGVLTQEQYDEWAGYYIHRNYEQHFFKDVKNLMKRGFKIDDIHKRGNIQVISEKEAKKLLVDPKFIANTQKPLRDGGQRLTKLANGKYELRRDWTRVERDAMNEIRDGAITIPETLMRLKRMADNAKFLEDVSKIDEVILKDAEKFSDDEISAAGFVKAPNSPKYGVLAGKHIRKDVFDDISARNDEIFNTFYGSDGAIARIWKNYLSLWKKSKTVWNVPSHLNNFMSNQFLMHLAGMRADEIVTSIGRAGKMMYEGNRLEKLMQKKMLGQATKAELKELEDMGEDLKYFLEAKDGGLLGRSQLNDILAGQQKIDKKGVLGKLDKFSEDMYHGEDAINKIAMYAHLREKVGMSADEARKAVLTIMPDYSKPMPMGYRVLRDTGISPFISWSYYTMPAIWKLLKTSQGAKKASLAMVTLAGLEYVLTGGAVTPLDNIPFYGGNKPEDFKGRRFGIGRSGDTIHTLKTDRWIPYIELTDPINFFVSNISGPTTNAVVNTLTAPSKAGMINPYYGRPVTYKNKGAGQKAYDYAKYLTQSYVPLPAQAYSGWNLIESLARSKKNRRRNKVIEPRTPTQEILKNIGLNSLSYSRSQARKENND